MHTYMTHCGIFVYNLKLTAPRKAEFPMCSDKFAGHALALLNPRKSTGRTAGVQKRRSVGRETDGKNEKI